MSGLFGFMKYRPVFWMSVVGTTAGISCLLKDLMQGTPYKKKISAVEKVVIVTGANTGIGKETVRDLAKRGAIVYMACRDLEKCEEAREEIVTESLNKNIYCRECNLSSFKSIQAFVTRFKEERDHLDILINNAAVMRCPRSLTQEGFEMQLGVNHIGHFLLTNLLLDMLKKSAPSRIVVVSCLSHTRGKINVSDLNSESSYDGGEAYNQSKLANLLFTKELAKRLEGTKVSVNAVNPGIADTEIGRHMGIFSNFIGKAFYKTITWPFFKTARNGAQTTLFAALDPDLEGVSGKYFSDCDFMDVAPVATDASLAKWLWLVSAKWTRLNVSD